MKTSGQLFRQRAVEFQFDRLDDINLLRVLPPAVSVSLALLFIVVTASIGALWYFRVPLIIPTISMQFLEGRSKVLFSKSSGTVAKVFEGEGNTVFQGEPILRVVRSGTDTAGGEQGLHSTSRSPLNCAEWTILCAPEDGQIEAMLKNEGDAIHVGDVAGIFRPRVPNEVWCYVSASDVHFLSAGLSVGVKLNTSQYLNSIIGATIIDIADMRVSKDQEVRVRLHLEHAVRLTSPQSSLSTHSTGTATLMLGKQRLAFLIVPSLKRWFS